MNIIFFSLDLAVKNFISPSLGRVHTVFHSNLFSEKYPLNYCNCLYMGSLILRKSEDNIK